MWSRKTAYCMCAVRCTVPYWHRNDKMHLSLFSQLKISPRLNPNHAVYMSVDTEVPGKKL